MRKNAQKCLSNFSTARLVRKVLNERGYVKMDSPKGYYVTQKPKLLRDFQKRYVKFARGILISHFGDALTDMVLKETRHEYEALIPQLPYNGSENDAGTRKLVESTWALASYRALKKHSRTVEEAGQISCEILSAQFNSIPLPLRSLMTENFFSKGLQEMKKAATESQKRLYPQGSVFIFVEGDGVEFDYGIDFMECEVAKFFHAQGADELMPHMCLHDFIVSKAFGTELVRTTTLAEGCEKCDLRYKRIKQTKQG